MEIIKESPEQIQSLLGKHRQVINGKHSSPFGDSGMNTRLLKIGIRVWLVDTLIAGFNFFVLMNLVYEPRWGTLVAHQIGMSTRIVIIFALAYFLLNYVKEYNTKDLILIGFVWLGLEEIFEWGGSFILRRPVAEILIGWNILAGYMWPYVMFAYLFSNLIIGTIIHPGKRKSA